MNDEKKAGRILIILTGGNIGLITTVEKNETVLKLATPDDFRRFLFPEGNNTVVLREGSLTGQPISVELHDLRIATDRRFADPEEFDSAQVNPKLWAQIANTIKEKYDFYEGFVVLHGLDTMAYTASALSFMLQNLQSPVIFTGSQRPLNFPRTDALQNIFSAITLAAAGSLGLKEMPEVTVYSYDTLFRANRASMVNASSYRTFDSPNFASLATVGEHIDVQSHLIRTAEHGKVLTADAKVDAKVVILDVFPGMEADIIEGLKPQQRKEDGSAIRGVLLRTYGMGTAPTSPAVLSALDALSDSEIVVMNVTQARSGRISHGQDPVSLRLFEQGVISGVDMTAEAAYAKMVVLLSQESSFTKVSDLLQLEKCGEQSQSIFHIHFFADQTREDESGEGTCRAILRARDEVMHKHILVNNLENVTYIQLRLLGIEPVKDESKSSPINRAIDLDVSLVDPAHPTTAKGHHLKQDWLRWFAKGRSTINIAYDITDAKERLLSRNRIPSTDVQLRTIAPIKWKRASIAIFTTVGDKGFGGV